MRARRVRVDARPDPHRLRAEGDAEAGLRNLPLHDTAQNRIWMEIVQIALDLLAWMPMLALTDDTRGWEPKRLRLRCSPPPHSS